MFRPSFRGRRRFGRGREGIPSSGSGGDGGLGEALLRLGWKQEGSPRLERWVREVDCGSGAGRSRRNPGRPGRIGWRPNLQGFGGRNTSAPAGCNLSREGAESDIRI